MPSGGKGLVLGPQKLSDNQTVGQNLLALSVLYLLILRLLKVILILKSEQDNIECEINHQVNPY